MSEKNENIMTEEEMLEEEFLEEEEEEEELMEVKKESKISKVVSGIKKHGKKIAVGAAVAAGTIIGYALLKGGSKDNNFVSGDSDNDFDSIDVTDSYEEVND